MLLAARKSAMRRSASPGRIGGRLLQRCLCAAAGVIISRERFWCFCDVARFIIGWSGPCDTDLGDQNSENGEAPCDPSGDPAKLLMKNFFRKKAATLRVASHFRRQLSVVIRAVKYFRARERWSAAGTLFTHHRCPASAVPSIPGSTAAALELRRLFPGSPVDDRDHSARSDTLPNSKFGACHVYTHRYR